MRIEITAECRIEKVVNNIIKPLRRRELVVQPAQVAFKYFVLGCLAELFEVLF
jgi:hypothetical protein